MLLSLSGDSAVPQGARIIRITTALGTFAVIVVNDLGPAANTLARKIEQDALRRLHAHRSLAPEMSTVEVQRGDMDTEVIEW